jgi:hypothetical protein
MTAISKCHVNYVHYVMFIMYIIPSAGECRLKSINPIMYSKTISFQVILHGRFWVITEEKVMHSATHLARFGQV